MTLKKGLLSTAGFVAVALVSMPAWAVETSSKEVTVRATVNVRAKLVLGVNAISFPDADASTTPTVAANENGSISVTTWVRSPRGSSANLSVVASDDLRSGEDTIAVQNVSWTASGDPEYQSGALSKSAQTVATFARSGRYDANYMFSMQNSAAYNPGAYATQVTYTLTVP